MSQDSIDAALESILKAAGTSLKNYTLPVTLERMREAMRRIMSHEYIAGYNADHKGVMGSEKG